MRYLPLLTVLAGTVVAPLVAQDASVGELLDRINGVLEANAYVDHDGQQAVSKVRMARSGVLVVEVAKRKAGNVVANEYEVSLADLDLTRVTARNRGTHVSLSLGARGPVTVRLKCTMAGGTTHEWNLPEDDEIAVEFAKNDAASKDLTTWIRELIRLARQQA
ncbi:MAG: hypothetical protein OER90_06225 [Gemmatimonadota bacterium]|nr:hypothetical protein [Gemmatimonadota bacterium]